MGSIDPKVFVRNSRKRHKNADTAIDPHLGIASMRQTLTSAAGTESVFASLPLVLGLVASAIIIAALYFGREILVPLALAFLLGFVLDPFVVRLKRLGIPRTGAVIIVVGITLAVIGATGALLGNQVRELSAELPTYQTNIQGKLRTFREQMNAPGIFDGAIKTFDIVQKEVENTPDVTANQEARPAAQRIQLDEAPVSPMNKAIMWLGAVGGPLANAGIVLVFLVLVLLDRQDMRNRLLRLLGGNLHRTTDAMDEAGTRITKYLTMQLIVNASYGIPMGIGLWLIGVPGAILWGSVAAIMRFVPYVGPLISAVFPLALAFAIDPGWSMLLWTLGLIVLLELVSNNLIEPWLYGASTGLSAMSLMVSATFWAMLWGPIGLVMSTPLTVCLLVIGRYLPSLHFLDVLLGSQPALDAPTHFYQRLLAGDIEEAIELAAEASETKSVSAFYHQVGIPALRMAHGDHGSISTAEHRNRVVIGMDRVLDELLDQQSASTKASRLRVVCIGGKGELDRLASRMLAHGLSLSGIAAESRIVDVTSTDFLDELDLLGATTVCLSHFTAEPQTQVRYLCKRLHRRWPDLNVVLTLWNAPSGTFDEAAYKTLGVDAVATSFDESIMRVSHHLGAQLTEAYLLAPVPENDWQRVRALRASGALGEDVLQKFARAAKRAADVFDMPLALVTLIDDETQHVCGASGGIQSTTDDGSEEETGSGFNMPRSLSICGHVVANTQTLVIEDIARDPRFANNPALQAKGLRFYAGSPFRDAQGFIYGSLCVLDVKPRTFSEREIRLLESLALEITDFLPAEVAEDSRVPLTMPLHAKASSWPTAAQSAPYL